MTMESIRVSAVIPASPERVYAAWLDSSEHSRMTGGKATMDARRGGRHTAWDGYIHGRNLALVKGKRIVQDWRTSEFPRDAPDSLLEIRLVPAPGGTRVTLVHTHIPEGQGERYKSGWHDHYFEPMQKYFGADAKAKPAAPPKAAKKPARRAAPKKAAKRASADKPRTGKQKKTAAKQAAPAKRATAKKTAKRAATKKAAPKKAAKRAAPKKAAPKKAAKRAAPKKVAKQTAKRAAAKKAAKKAAKRAPEKTASKPAKRAARARRK